MSNNIMWFDQMNILEDEKKMRIKIADSLENELIDIFKWVASFGSNFFYWQLLETKMHDRYKEIMRKECMYYDDEMIEVLAMYFYDNIIDFIDKAEREDTLVKALTSTKARDMARNETNLSVNTLKDAEMINLGYRYKTWKTTVDGKERKSHRLANNQKVEIKKPFVISGYSMMFPMDSSYDAPLTEILGCRCAVEYSFE